MTELALPVWSRGARVGSRAVHGRLVFGRMNEDERIELRALVASERVVCVASGGDVALALAEAGHDVLAVDINPAQVAHVRRRSADLPVEEGFVDRAMQIAASLHHPLGLQRGDVDRFLAMTDCAQQVSAFERLLTRRARLALRAALAAPLLRLAYSPSFVTAVPARLDRVLLERVRRGLRRHPNADNPFLAGYFGRHHQDGVGPVRRGHLTARTGDVAAVLEGMSAASVDGVALSNVLDGCRPAYRLRLERAVAHAVRPGGIVITRSLTVQPAPADGIDVAAEDRSLIWGSVIVRRVG